ncbi:hypothetical protein KCU92_g7235, partial [Aureobasidium melanogenum]
MSSGRLVITIDDDNVDNTTENQVQRLLRELNEARTTIAYLRVDLSSIQAENTRLQAENARFQAKFARLRAQLEVELLEDPYEDNQPRPNAPGDGGRQLRSFRGFHQETHPPKRPRTEPQDSVDARRELLTNSANNGLLDGHEEADEKIMVRVNQDGDLETDAQVDQQGWYELEAAWAVQVQQFDQKNKDWPSVDLKGKCLWSTVISKPTAQHWTTEEPGRLTCRQCANKLRICAGQVNGTLQLLPLPPLPFSADHEVGDLLGSYVVKKDGVSRRAPPVWS